MAGVAQQGMGEWVAGAPAACMRDGSRLPKLLCAAHAAAGCALRQCCLTRHHKVGAHGDAVEAARPPARAEHHHVLVHLQQGVRCSSRAAWNGRQASVRTFQGPPFQRRCQAAVSRAVRHPCTRGARACATLIEDT